MTAEGLTEAERDRLAEAVFAEGYEPAWTPVLEEVERILADRLAAVQAERDEAVRMLAKRTGSLDMAIASAQSRLARAQSAEAERDALRERVEALAEAADFIEATAGIGAGGSDYADGWYAALDYALGEFRSRAAVDADRSTDPSAGSERA